LGRRVKKAGRTGKQDLSRSLNWRRFAPETPAFRRSDSLLHPAPEDSMARHHGAAWLGPQGIVGIAAVVAALAFMPSPAAAQFICDSTTGGGPTSAADGSYAAACGVLTTASGDHSTAVGTWFDKNGDGTFISVGPPLTFQTDEFTSATQTGASAFGAAAQATGQFSTAVGTLSTAAGDSSVAIGNGAVVNAGGTNSVAVGAFNTVTGTNSGAFGTGQTVNGNGSFAIGDPNTVNGNNSFVFGDNNNVNTTTGGGAGTAGWGDGINVVGSDNTVASTASAAGASVLGNGTTVNAASAIAIGNGTTVTGLAGIAIGTNSTASGGFSIASGMQSTASGVGAAAYGSGSTASGPSGTAVGINSTASGSGSTALGALSSAGGVSSVAIGSGASAGLTGSAAFGAGATAARANQQAFGTATNTYTMAGITSAASKAAQTGATQLVTSDAGGNLATTTLADLGLAGSGEIAAINRQIAGLNSRIDDLSLRTDKAMSGVAMAFAMAGVPTLLPSERFAVTMNYGTFEGANGLALNAAFRLSDNIQFNGGIGYGPDQNIAGGRVGLRMAW
jgi:hypothetical protein